MRAWPVLTFLAFGIRRGYLGTQHIGAVETFDDGATLDVPGTPRVIHVPGHTAGSVAFHLPDRSTLVVGDALITLNVVNGQTGPQMFPNFTLDNRAALASLGRFDGIEADVVLPGHGERWTGGVAEAVRIARGSRPA